MTQYMKKEFVMERITNLNGTYTYEYNDGDEDILYILSHLLGHDTSIIFTEEHFRKVRNLALDHGWKIIEQEKEIHKGDRR